jgi:mono/diheme cytochrome c family protein
MRRSTNRKMHSTFLLKVIPLSLAFVTVFSVCHAQGKTGQKHAVRQPDVKLGRETFQKYCASCHGIGGEGNGPAAFALRPAPSDLTLSRRHEGKFPTGYVGALLVFGRNLTAHGSDDMPVWGSRFKMLDPVHDPTGQQHVDDVVAYIASLQVK